MQILLTGATGFVGSHLFYALEAAGHRVVCGTRNVAKARAAHPERQWAELNAEKPATIERAMEACQAAYYLIHGMSKGGSDYPSIEAQSARNFAMAAERCQLQRIIYLGGIIPATGGVSRHLTSRRRTGECLRGGRVRALELRAAMIMGAGSSSWTMVRDLSERLPAMLLPRWLANHSHPIAIDDVVFGLLAALDSLDADGDIFELPGPERISHREVLNRVAAVRGHRRPMISVPILTPRLSSYWIALITRIDLALARELVEGIRSDLDPTYPLLWQYIPHRCMTLEEAARLAFADEKLGQQPSVAAIARMRDIGARPCQPMMA